MSCPERACRHCGRVKRIKVQGLCSGCAWHEWIRALYPPAQAVKKITPASALPLPTSAIPGTEAKVAILEERWHNNLQLWHPDDFNWFEWDGDGVDEEPVYVDLLRQDRLPNPLFDQGGERRD